MDLLRDSAAANETSSDNEFRTSSAQETNKQIRNMTGKEIIENIFLAQNNLYSLTNGFIEYISKLVDLDLSNSGLHTLPKSLNMLKRLVSLNLSNNQFSSIPNVICELYNLENLWASGNKIKYLPYNLGNLSKLETLSFNTNQLKDLPNSFAKLNQLKVCRFSTNKFKKIPNCIARGMESLQILEFSQNNHINLDIYPKSTNLTAFYAEENDICPSFPNWILSSSYKKLETVSLNKTRFETFHQPTKTSICYIKKLFMKQCDLNSKTVEFIIAGMINLEELVLGNKKVLYQNYFSIMPINTKERPCSLKELDIQTAGLRQIPKTIKGFFNLINLNLSCNNIFFLPKEICTLRNLVTLIIDRNHLATLPKNFGKLTSLKELKLCHNQLIKLPSSMKSLRNLEYVDLYDNEFEALPTIILFFPNLKGLDLEQNYFSTEHIVQTRWHRYKNMRAVLRNYWMDSIFRSKSFRGRKLKIFMNKSNILQFPSSSDSDSECSWNSADNAYTKRWDPSEDSADEFDPHECKKPKQRYYPPLTFYQPYQEIYRPADFHESKVQTRVKKMLECGAIARRSSYEEGQFEDA
ncbi:leucine-rich repeat protein SHOC-2-like [Bombus pyrosoma]|uniref:leucine-rich repeat protein SHOC-2-like n=1 Tax=Bombus pyrosoma TaxID=396416 RepID=UPI001CB9B51F|nr:leucine-rich repeat protein SHOC-2-like [Bombus pyrosoma]XP_043585621.1 leucine-rich repeat protein SHOC-2-like [Bombus pyrosoma]